MQRLVSRPRTRTGFTLVELAVVIVIIGVLAAFGVPKFLNSVERSKASEAFGYLSAVRSAEERYMAQYGKYADDVTNLDIKYPPLKYFTNPGTPTVTSSTTGTAPTWTLTLTRLGAAAGYDGYTVTFTQDGFDTANSTIATFPQINPVDTSGSSGSSSGSGSGSGS
jgi:prepilin-type N-terminal cleavage/methylation domain-containing protein